MDKDLEVVFDNLDHSAVTESMIREKSRKLERFYHHIIEARVIVSLPHQRHQQGNDYHITLEVQVPGERLVVSKSPGDPRRHTEAVPTINDAFATMARRLEDYVHRRRGDTKHHFPPGRG